MVHESYIKINISGIIKRAVTILNDCTFIKHNYSSISSLDNYSMSVFTYSKHLSTDRQTDRQTDTHTHTETDTHT